MNISFWWRRRQTSINKMKQRNYSIHSSIHASVRSQSWCMHRLPMKCLLFYFRKTFVYVIIDALNATKWNFNDLSGTAELLSSNGMWYLMNEKCQRWPFLSLIFLIVYSAFLVTVDALSLFLSVSILIAPILIFTLHISHGETYFFCLSIFFWFCLSFFTLILMLLFKWTQ